MPSGAGELMQGTELLGPSRRSRPHRLHPRVSRTHVRAEADQRLHNTASHPEAPSRGSLPGRYTQPASVSWGS